MNDISDRIAIERSIVEKVAKALIGAGYQLTVNDGEEDVLEYSTDVSAVLAAMFSTDEDYLKATQAGPAGHSGWVRFIYGNGGYDVINDHTIGEEFEAALAPVFAEIERLEEEAD